MRKAVLALCLAAFASLLALGGGGMNRRRILAALGSHTPTAKDYVQDGLVAMWDGIENAGWGVHDPNATVWKDLAGNRNLRLYGDSIWKDSYIELNRSDKSGCYVRDDNTSSLSSLSGLTIEYVIRPIGFHNYSALIQLLPYEADREGWIYGSGLLVPLRWVEHERTNGFHVNDNEICNAAATIRADNGKLSYAKNGNYTGDVVNGGLYAFEGCYVSFFGANGYYFWGDAFAMRIYERCLTADEIAANYAVDKARFGLP